ncbi:inositol monophosphatase family protein [Nocardia carnea]|uniref:inositol monophosphatase family protein n=1 Tax=Nocardia carnea TaxID=37328 RepID=UPI002456139E|nr:inositol monophosphatase family protein [Nocardia carnea]
MTAPELTALLTIARAAVAEGAALLASAVPGAVHAKGERDYVTELDLEVQRTVQMHLNAATPHIEFLGEESSSNRAAALEEGPLWILDPIDGTSNYIHGLPLCAVSLALVREGRPRVGVIRAPFLGLEYYAAEGLGAYVDDQLITTGRARRIGEAIVSIGDYAVGADAAATNRARFALTQHLAAVVERIRMFGSAALDLAWVAEGRTDGCVILSNKPWDMAAGVVIARESGAVVTDSDGTDHSMRARHTIAANPVISRELLRMTSESLDSAV